MPGAPPLDDRLDSWKEIAAYLKRDVTTVQRWEKREGMPVHRHLHEKLGSVYAFSAELDAWAKSRKLRLEADAGQEGLAAVAPAEPTRRRQPSAAWVLAVAGVVLGVAVAIWLVRTTDYFWTSPIAGAQFRQVTDFDGSERAAAVSRDGRFVAFLSDRDGPTDVWVTQVGTGRFYNLTRGAFPDLVNPSVRAIGFSPDGALVRFWARVSRAADDIGIWEVPTLGGEARPYLEGAAECDWANDGSSLVYHTAAAGDPMFVRNAASRADDRRIFTAPSGEHAHFPLWSPDRSFIYFVEGAVPDAMDVWRIPVGGGAAERLTHHHARVSYPVLLNRRTLVYLAGDSSGDGQWLFSMDVNRRVAHRLGSGVDRYTSLAASADGQRLVVTLARPRETLWRLTIPDIGRHAPTPSRVPVSTGRASAPRLGPDYLLYASTGAAGDALWKLAHGTASELWSAQGARIVGGAAISADGRRLAFAVDLGQKTLLYVMNADGTGARLLTDSLGVKGSPAWAPDGRSLVVAASDGAEPRLFTVPVNGGQVVRLPTEYALDPAWSPDGRFIVYSGPDIGTRFAVKAIGPDGRPYPLPPIVLTRGARLRFLPGQPALLLLRGDIQHKDLWLLDLPAGSERQVTALPSDFDARDFDVSPDGREVVLHRVQEESDVVLLDLSPH